MDGKCAMCCGNWQLVPRNARERLRAAGGESYFCFWLAHPSPEVPVMVDADGQIFLGVVADSDFGSRTHGDDPQSLLRPKRAHRQPNHLFCTLCPEMPGRARIGRVANGFSLDGLHAPVRRCPGGLIARVHMHLVVVTFSDFPTNSCLLGLWQEP